MIAKPQPTETLDVLQRTFLTNVYRKVSAMEKFANLDYKPSEVIVDLLNYHMPVKVAKRVGSGEYEIHETLESCMLGVFEKKLLEVNSSPAF